MLGRCGCQEPDRPPTDHEKALSWSRLCAAHSVPGDGAGFDQACVFHVQLRGQSQQRVFRHHHRFGQAAVSVNPEASVADFSACPRTTSSPERGTTSRPEGRRVIDVFELS
ncbi:hypothetical protein GCM10020216_031430 [Nonomuraea helvata]